MKVRFGSRCFIKKEIFKISSVNDWTVICFHLGESNRFYKFHGLKAVSFNWIQTKQLREISGTAECYTPRIIRKKLLQKAKIFN